MFKKICRSKSKFIVFLLCLGVAFVLGVPCRINAQAVSLSIRQEVSTSSGQPGDVIQLLVYVQGMPSSIEAAQVRGVLEYDTSLFTVQQVAGDGLGTASVDSSGNFSLSNSTGKSFGNGDLLFHISLLVKDGASVGKTTVCVNEIVITDSSGISNQISNYVPSAINLEASSVAEEPEQEADEEEQEEDQDYEDYEYDDFEDVDDYNSVKTGSSDKKNLSTSKKRITTTSTTAKKSATAGKAAKLDENYKTGAGFGNDIYLIVAGIMGLGGVALYILRRKWMRDTHKYL